MAKRIVVAVTLAGLAVFSSSPANRETDATVTNPSYNAATINDPESRAVLGQTIAGSAVVRAQILLDRAHFSPGEIDGHWGDNLRVAIVGYQAARKLNQSGMFDQDTWEAVNSDTTPALVPYTIIPEDEAGPFERIPHAMALQAKLKRQSAQEELGERFHINPALLSRINAGKRLTTAGEEIMVPNVVREYSVPADRVVVSKNSRTVSAFKADGTLLAQYPATMGSEHDPLPIGDWKITEIDHYPWFHYNPKLFWDAHSRDSKAKLAPGSNNPVGVVWIGLSKEHYGIHGTPEPNRIGHTESHGCVRLTNWDAEELSKMVGVAHPQFCKTRA